MKRFTGFTLAELLIALAILGIIATFTIPKIISAQRDQKYNASAKEFAATLSDAYQRYRFKNGNNVNLTWTSLTPYMNYVKIDTESSIDSSYTTTTTATCGGGCLQLHNGARVRPIYCAMGGTASTNAISFIFDPDGVITDGTTNGPGKAVSLFLYYNGRIASRGTIEPNTCDSCGGCSNPHPPFDPPWFSW